MCRKGAQEGQRKRANADARPVLGERLVSSPGIPALGRSAGRPPPFGKGSGIGRKVAATVNAVWRGRAVLSCCLPTCAVFPRRLSNSRDVVYCPHRGTRRVYYNFVTRRALMSRAGFPPSLRAALRSCARTKQPRKLPWFPTGQLRPADLAALHSRRERGEWLF